MGLAALSTIMDLFVEGRVASVEAPDGRLIPVWVNKLSAFEKEDTDRFARAARAKRVLSWDASDDEQAIYTLETSAYSDEDIINALKAQRNGQYFVEAVTELRADKEWTERLDYLAQAEVLEVGGPDASPEDKEMFERITTEYTEAITSIQQRLLDAYGEELVSQGRDKLMETYRVAWRDMEGMRAFYEERRIAEIFFAARECKAKPKGDGTWDHAKCHHEVRLLSNRGEVRSLPQPFLVAIADAIEILDIPPDQVGNSAAPTVSSEPSEPQSAVEDSIPFGPDEMSDEPAGT